MPHLSGVVTLILLSDRMYSLSLKSGLWNRESSSCRIGGSFPSLSANLSSNSGPRSDSIEGD